MAEKLPACFLGDLIHALMARGRFGQMAEDAIVQAEKTGRKDQAALYRNMLVQVSDYYSQSDDGTIRIALKPE